jgi:hypothetical protein
VPAGRSRGRRLPPAPAPLTVCRSRAHATLQALALEFGERNDSTDGNDALAGAPDSTFYEITIATVDQPKLLSRLSDAMVGCTQAGSMQRALRGAAVAAAAAAVRRAPTCGGTSLHSPVEARRSACARLCISPPPPKKNKTRATCLVLFLG